MDDDATKPTGEEVVPDQPQPSEPAPSEAPEVPETPEIPEETPPEEEPEAPPEAPPSRREQLRVQDLLRKGYRPATPAPSQSGPNFRDQVEADDEVLKSLEDTARQYGSEQYQAGQNVAEYTTWERFLQMDEKVLRSQHDILNPAKKDVYHGVLEKALQEKYLRFVGYDAGNGRDIGPSVQNPNVSYADYVEAEMEFSDELASLKTQATSQNIAKQAANTALRPDGSTPKRMDLTKDPGDMSDEELQAAIKATMPRDARGRFTSS